jgi:hypothetical protein
MPVETLAASKRPLEPARALLLGTLTVGTLDILDVFVYSLFRGSNPVRVLQGIASGLLGRASFSGGAQTAALGLAIHFFIAFAVVGTYFAASRWIPALRRRPFVFGPAYGVGVFLFMNLVVIPLAGLRIPPYTPRLVNGVLIHIFGVGLPAALFARAAFLERPKGTNSHGIE